jgi:polyisoprenoid-binding protein YceI
MKSINGNKFLYLGFVLILLSFSCKNEVKKEVEKTTKDQTIENSNEVKTDKGGNLSGEYILNSDSSVINWSGSKPAGKHNGKIKIKSGEIKFNNQDIISGKFTIDMTSITVLDLDGDEKSDLENHLKGNIPGKEDHFFNVKEYPEAVFILKSADRKNNNYSLYGELTIKGVANPVKFGATVDFSRDLKELKITTEDFEIDRTKWGIEYMSKSIFDDLKERFIYDDIGLKVIIKASKV